MEKVAPELGFERLAGRMGNGVSGLINSIGIADGLPVFLRLA